MTEQKIHNICKVYNISNYKINSDGSIDVNGNVDLSHLNLNKIPIKFNIVKGYFKCSNNKLKTLENSPNEVVRGYFNCSWNRLSNLLHSPRYLDGFFYCSENTLKSLDGYNNDYSKLVTNQKLDKIIRKDKIKRIRELL